MSTNYHAKYFANELTKRSASDSVEKLAATLSDAQVDLNPHQIEASLFAFQSPLSKGAILADEVGLGKTIEASLLLAQHWAEGKRRLLVIAPSNLRKQWSQELVDKFFLPSVILESRTFNEAIAKGNLNPFQQEGIILCSFQFVKSKEPYVRQTDWDLVVIDEAHRLRNVYKPNNKIANSIKNSILNRKKVLLTATPLQNSLMELYGLVSFIDDFTFGDLKSFRSQFSRLEGGDEFKDLKERLKPICKRTLRKQVQYVPFTNRFAVVQEFIPSPDEQKLYDLVTEYLQRNNLYALPSGQRQLMTLILRKLLASSTYAISNTLDGLAQKLEASIKENEPVQGPPEDIDQNLEEFSEIEDEWAEDDDDTEEGTDKSEKRKLTSEELSEVKKERETLKELYTLAKSITKNSKGEVLLMALRRGFEASLKAQKEKGAAKFQQKAIIFTESRRTQEYLQRVLESTEFAGKTVLFNGSNTDPLSKQIYVEWLELNAGTDRVSGSPGADKRAALVEYFRDKASIMIATEAAAEGINLQFCNLVVNYDLPWNPQRIEQRIGRCHRYGQKFDVVVVNFLNKNNAADKRVYELLAEKFKLFNGVFGTSDEVLGNHDSGLDFEKRIMGIYQKCRTSDQIEFEFDELQKEYEVDINDLKREAREKLLNNFDQEVVDKVRVTSNDYLGRYEGWLWQLTKYYLAPFAQFDEKNHAFVLEKNPFEGEVIHPGPYRLGKNVEDANIYRPGHPLAHRILQNCKVLEAKSACLKFKFTDAGKKITTLDSLLGKSGWLACRRYSLTAFETEDFILFSGVSDDGQTLDENQCRRFFDLAAEVAELGEPSEALKTALVEKLSVAQHEASEKITTKNAGYFDREMDKLDRWADDKRHSLKVVLDELEVEIKTLKREARLAPNLPTKLELQRKLRLLETKRNEAWKEFDNAANELDHQKETLLDDIGKRLEQKAVIEDLFMIRWQLI